LYGWLTSTGVLREKYKQCVQDETSFTKANLHAPILSKYCDVKSVIVFILKKQRAAGQPLYRTIVQPLIKAEHYSKESANLLDSNSQTRFKVSIEWTKSFMKKNP
jgi:hypothetical protein